LSLMPTWNELFLDPRNIKRAPVAEIYRFVRALDTELAPLQPPSFTVSPVPGM
jgi:hypothetical protein